MADSVPSGRVVDANNLDQGFLWPQYILLERFNGVEEDMSSLVVDAISDSNCMSLVQRQAFLEGFNLAMTQVSLILQERFNELSRARERQNKVNRK